MLLYCPHCKSSHLQVPVTLSAMADLNLSEHKGKLKILPGNIRKIVTSKSKVTEAPTAYCPNCGQETPKSQLLIKDEYQSNIYGAVETMRLVTCKGLMVSKGLAGTVRYDFNRSLVMSQDKISDYIESTRLNPTQFSITELSF